MPARIFISMCLAIFIALPPATLRAQSTDAIAPPPPSKQVGEPYVPPEAPRQGGDTVANATVIPSLPYNDTGTTAGYTHDYTANCFSNTTAPDVVYSFVAPPGYPCIRISLCGSTYDTGLIIYDASLTQVGCNDDFCGLQSEIPDQPVTPGAMYYIVVTGYSSASGAYTLYVSPPPPGCALVCPNNPNVHEGEPPLNDDYVDLFNGGCNTSPSYPFQHIPGALMPGSTIPAGSAVWCGLSGWYLNAGANFRDTDWYTLTVGPTGAINITADAESPSYIYELAGECGNVTVVQQETAGPCAEAFMTITGTPGSTKWFWVGPTVFVMPGCFGVSGYDYTFWIDGLLPETIALEAASWGEVKALYR